MMGISWTIQINNYILNIIYNHDKKDVNNE